MVKFDFDDSFANFFDSTRNFTHCALSLRGNKMKLFTDESSSSRDKLERRELKLFHQERHRNCRQISENH